MNAGTLRHLTFAWSLKKHTSSCLQGHLSYADYLFYFSEAHREIQQWLSKHLYCVVAAWHSTRRTRREFKLREKGFKFGNLFPSNSGFKLKMRWAAEDGEDGSLLLIIPSHLSCKIATLTPDFIQVARGKKKIVNQIQYWFWEAEKLNQASISGWGLIYLLHFTHFLDADRTMIILLYSINTQWLRQNSLTIIFDILLTPLTAAAASAAAYFTLFWLSPLW